VRLLCTNGAHKRADALHLVCRETRMVCIGVQQGQIDVHWCALVCKKREMCHCVHHTISKG
jgi:hypothetical protein